LGTVLYLRRAPGFYYHKDMSHPRNTFGDLAT